MIPNLEPYPAYQDSGVSWLGDIPAHWQQLPGRACLVEKKTPNVGMQETTVLSLSYGQIVVKPPEKLHGLVPASFETYQIIEPYDIVIRPTDLQNDWVSLRTGLAKTRGIITSAYMRLQTKGSLDPQYGHLLLHAYDLKKVFYGLGSGLRQNLSWRDFKYLPCLVPPPDEQAAIARFLHYVNRRTRRYIRAQKKLIALLEEQKQAIIQRAVTRSLDPNVRLKPSGVDWIGEMPGHWQIASVRRLITFITSGSRGWAKFYSDNGDLFIQSGNLGRSMALDLANVHRVRVPSGAEGQRTRIAKDDVLVCVTGALTGNVAFVNEDLPPAYVNQHVALVRPDPELILPRFLASALYSPFAQAQFKLTEYGGTKQGLGLDDVRNVVIFVPSVEEQHQIVAHLDAQTTCFSKLIDGVKRKIGLIREYRTRLIADVVTGKLDVRQAAAKLPDEVAEPEDLDEVEEVEEDDSMLDEEKEDENQ